MKIRDKRRAFRKIDKLAPAQRDHLMSVKERGMLGEYREVPNALGLNVKVQMGYCSSHTYTKLPELSTILVPEVKIEIDNFQKKDSRLPPEYVEFDGRNSGWNARTLYYNYPWLKKFIKKHFETGYDRCHLPNENAPAKFLEILSGMGAEELVSGFKREARFRKDFHKRLEGLIKEVESKEDPKVKEILEIVGTNRITNDDIGSNRLAQPMLELYAHRLGVQNPLFFNFPWWLEKTHYNHLPENVHLRIGNLNTFTKLPEEIILRESPETLVKLLNLEKDKPLEDSELATIVFSDCRSRFMAKSPERQLVFADIIYKAPEELSTDGELLKSLLEFGRTRKDGDGLHVPPSIMTECTRLKGKNRNYFAKRLDASKLPYCDYELDMASRLSDKGIDVQEPKGLAILRRTPFALFEYADNSVSLTGLDSSYRSGNPLLSVLHGQEAEVYSALGKYVRNMVDKGVYDRDMAKRNFMAQFHPDGKLNRVFMVDYEKTISKKKLSQTERDEALALMMTSNLSESERSHFKRGYETQRGELK